MGNKTVSNQDQKNGALRKGSFRWRNLECLENAWTLLWFPHSGGLSKISRFLDLNSVESLEIGLL